MMEEEIKTHVVRSVVVNGAHVWECKICGVRWLPIYTAEELEKLSDCGA